MDAIEPHVPEVTATLTDPVLIARVPAGTMTADPYTVYLDSLESDLSRKAMGGCLDYIATLILAGWQAPPPGFPRTTGAGRSWWLLRYEHTARLRSLLMTTDRIVIPRSGAQQISPATINKYLAALRGVIKTCWRLGLMSTDDYMRAVDIRAVKGERLAAGRMIHPDEMAAMFAACGREKGPIRYRDEALLAWLESTGGRRDEASQALIEDYDARERSHRIIGKRNKQRLVWIHPAAARPIEAWVAQLGERRGRMFRSVNKGGRIGTSLSEMAVTDIVVRIARAAGLPPTSPHDFRRTWIGNFLDAGGDLRQGQRVMGHVSIETTAGYDRRDDIGIRDVVDKMHMVAPEAGEGEW